MGISRAADLYYTYRFLKTLITPWDEMDAFKEGIIDDEGKNLIKARKLTTNDQKDAYTTFHRLVFNIKRILEKIPFGKSRIASYAAALYLLREETGMSEEAIMNALDELGVSDTVINENTTKLWPGDYMLNENINDMIKGSIISLTDTAAIGEFAGVTIYKTTNGLYITAENIT